MIIFKGFLPRNYLQNCIFRCSLTKENFAKNEQILRIVVAYLFISVCAMLGRPWCGDVRRPHHRRATWSAPPSPSRATKWLVKPLTGGAKKHIIGVSSEITTCDILCGVAAALRRSREGAGKAAFGRNLTGEGAKPSPWGKEVFHGRKAGGGNFARISRK